MGRSTIYLLILLAATSLVMAGIAGMGLMPPQTFTADNNGKNVTVNNGETLWLRLPENPTTGHAWKISASDGLAQLSERYEPADRSGLKVGVGGSHSWEFKATKKGPQTIRGVYLRSCEAPAGVTETYALNVNVVEGGLLGGLLHLPRMIAGQYGLQPAQGSLKPTVSLKGPALPEFPIINAGTSEPPLPAARNQRSPQDIQVTHTDVPREDTVTANVGDTIHLSLPENPSTGYSWQMTLSDGLEQVSDNYIQGGGGLPGRTLVGAGGTHEWTFKVTKPGMQTVSGVYRRPWEGSSEGEKTYVLNIIATPD